MDRSLRKRYLYKMLKQMTVSIEKELNNKMKELGLTAMQSYLLLYIWKQFPHELCAADIQEAFGLAQPTISKYMKTLKNKGYIKIIQSHLDERQKCITASQKLLNQGNHIENMIIEVEQKIYSDVTLDDLSRLIPLNEKILKRKYKM